jgi:hypothetical protein
LVPHSLLKRPGETPETVPATEELPQLQTETRSGTESDSDKSEPRFTQVSTPAQLGLKFGLLLLLIRLWLCIGCIKGNHQYYGLIREQVDPSEATH